MMGGASGTAVLPELPSQRVAALGQQPGQLQSTFARDQLQRFAQEADEASFVIEMASIFGVDVPLSAYQRLYQEAQAGLRLPPYKVGFGGSAEYEAGQDCIWVDESLACRAARNEAQAAWQLLQALLQAWGQYVAHQLRVVWSQQGSVPQTQAYALALLNLSEANSTTFAELKHPEISGPIVVQQSEPRRVARLQAQHYQDATQAAQADGVMLHDGVYRPERDGGFKVVPVFDAKMMKDDPQHGVHNHHTIEQVLIHPELFNSEEVGYIYYGNWLRDWSQMCDSFMLPPGVKGMGLSREHITTAVMLMGQVVATTYFKGGAWDKARGFIEFKKANLQQCMQRLGCYRPEEHMDNPAGLPDSRQHRFPSGWLVDLPVDKRVLEVNPATGLRRYIGDVDQTGAYPSSLVYMQRQLAIACRLGRTPEGLMHLGFALHVLEDYFAHTNFVELALVKAGSPKVVAWVPEHPDLLQRPITTGQFTTQDIYYSLTYKLSDLLLPASQTNERMGKLHYDGLELADWVVWALLTDAGRTWTAAAFKANCLVMYQAAELAKGAVPEVVQKGVAQARNWAYGYVAAGLKTQVAGRVRAAQIDHYDFATSMDPTHTMLAKDANDHPLHDLAATLAREAVADVGWCIHRFWQSQGSSADVLACASKYFAHPAKSTLFDKFVTDWRDAHKDRVAGASSRSKALERAKEHQHGGHHDEHRHLPQQFDQMWAFSGQHYAQLFGRDDVTGGLDAGDFA